MTGPDPRTVRVRPASRKSAAQLIAAAVPFRLTLLAPNEGDNNTLRLTLWLEVRVVNDRDIPLANERCTLWVADGTSREGRTDSDGVVRFDGLPFLCDVDTPFADINMPALQLPDVLEEWTPAPIGNFAKPDAYRARDAAVRFVPVETTRHPVRVNTLSEEHKFQHFVSQYVDNGARYWTSEPRKYDDDGHRWMWGRGAVCNQHVNFFLGYWFNYNRKFTTSGSATMMTCLPLYSSDKHEFKLSGETIRHRGYAEFVEPLEGYGSALSDDPLPSAASCSKAYRGVEYIRVSKYLERGTGNSRGPLGTAFLAALGNFNVYSVADIKKGDRDDAVRDVRAWLKKHKDTNGLTNAQIAAKSANDIWDIVYDLDDEDEADREIIRTLRNRITWDHHAGVLLRRAAGGGEPRLAPFELWTFSADGSTSSSNGPLIELKKFADHDLDRKFLHLGIWKLKPLRPGGYAAAECDDNPGGISVDEASRHIHWG